MARTSMISVHGWNVNVVPMSWTQSKYFKSNGMTSKNRCVSSMIRSEEDITIPSEDGLNDDSPNEGDQSSWMDKNSRWDDQPSLQEEAPRRRRRTGDYPKKREDTDFQNTRVFVEGIPPNVSWQTLKDHMRIAGNVMFASVSINAADGSSKGHGIVQYETPDEAQTAIKIMRDNPLQGATLFVRPDYQEREKRATGNHQATMGTSWRCADDEDTLQSYFASRPEDRSVVESLVKARDSARRRRNYQSSDSMREQLKEQYGVFIDDRLKLWWVETGGPQQRRPNKNDRNQQSQPWRFIPTTPERDSSVDPMLIEGLLAQRDIARMEKDYATADYLLKQVVEAPAEEELTVRVRDDHRTWRVWSEENPQRSSKPVVGPVEQCLILVQTHDPDKMAEVRNLLMKFPGREYNILKQLKKRYNVTT